MNKKNTYLYKASYKKSSKKLKHMASSTMSSRYSIHSLHRRLIRGEEIVMELAINATTYLDPDKYFLLKVSTKVQDIKSVLELIEAETVENCEIAYFDDDSQLLGEFKAKEFMSYYNVESRF